MLDLGAGAGQFTKLMEEGQIGKVVMLESSSAFLLCCARHLD